MEPIRFINLPYWGTRRDFWVSPYRILAMEPITTDDGGTTVTIDLKSGGVLRHKTSATVREIVATVELESSW